MELRGVELREVELRGFWCGSEGGVLNRGVFGVELRGVELRGFRQGSAKGRVFPGRVDPARVSGRFPG